MNKDFLLKNPITSSLINQGLKAYRLLSANLVDFKYDKARSPSITEQELKDFNKNRKLGAKKNLCNAPSISMFFSFEGQVMACCQNRMHLLGDITQESLHDIWFGEKRKALEKIINEDYNLEHGCHRCLISIQSKDYSSTLSQNYDFHIGKIGDYPKRLEFEMHNTCNLECVMCNGEFSSAIRINRENRNTLPYIYTDKFIEELNEFIPHISYSNFVGGEPTLINHYYKIWEKIIEVNPKCLIHIQTNGTVLKAKFKELLNKGNFEIGVSLDSLDKSIMESIRKNLNWEIFKDNLDYYLNLYKENKIKLTINFCPMPVNRTQIVPVLEFGNKYKLPVYFCLVESPYQHSFLSSSPEYMEEVINELSKINLPGKTYYENNNKNQLSGFIDQLRHWQQVAHSKEEKRDILIHHSIENLKMQCEDFLEKIIPENDTSKIKEELKECIYTAIEVHETKMQKEILIFLITTFDAPVYQTEANNLISKLKLDIVEYIEFIIQKRNTVIYN